MELTFSPRQDEFGFEDLSDANIESSLPFDLALSQTISAQIIESMNRPEKVGNNMVSKDDAYRELDASGGRDGMVLPDSGVNRDWLDYYIDNRKVLRAREQATAYASNSFGGATSNFLMTMAVEMADPIGLTAGALTGGAFRVAGIGRAAIMTARKRAFQAAAENAIGEAFLAPLRVSTLQPGDEYTRADFIADMTFSAAFGGAIGGAAQAINNRVFKARFNDALRQNGGIEPTEIGMAPMPFNTDSRTLLDFYESSSPSMKGDLDRIALAQVEAGRVDPDLDTLIRTALERDIDTVISTESLDGLTTELSAAVRGSVESMLGHMQASKDLARRSVDQLVESIDGTRQEVLSLLEEGGIGAELSVRLYRNQRQVMQEGLAEIQDPYARSRLTQAMNTADLEIDNAIPSHMKLYLGTKPSSDEILNSMRKSAAANGLDITETIETRLAAEAERVRDIIEVYPESLTKAAENFDYFSAHYGQQSFKQNWFEAAIDEDLASRLQIQKEAGTDGLPQAKNSEQEVQSFIKQYQDTDNPLAAEAARLLQRTVDDTETVNKAIADFMTCSIQG